MERRRLAWRGRGPGPELAFLLRQLYRSGEHVDVLLSAEYAGGGALGAHAAVLAACSPVLRSLMSNLSPACDVIHIVFGGGVAVSHLACLLELLYEGELKVNRDQLGGVEELLRDLGIAGISLAETRLITDVKDSLQFGNDNFYMIFQQRYRPGLVRFFKIQK